MAVEVHHAFGAPACSCRRDIWRAVHGNGSTCNGSALLPAGPTVPRVDRLANSDPKPTADGKFLAHVAAFINSVWAKRVPTEEPSDLELKVDVHVDVDEGPPCQGAVDWMTADGTQAARDERGTLTLAVMGSRLCPPADRLLLPERALPRPAIVPYRPRAVLVVTLCQARSPRTGSTPNGARV